MAFEYLSTYKTFESVADMDKSVEDHIAAHFYDLTESERAIVFKLASHSLEHTGTCHLKASTIADALEISTKTVYRSVAKLAKLGIIEKVPGTKMNGIKGANIYRILPYVPSSVSRRVDAPETDHDAITEGQSENLSFSSSNLYKHANNIISLGEELALQAEKKKAFMNEWQVTLYDFLYSLPLRDDLKDQLHKVVLASQMDNARDFVLAKDVLLNIVRDINSGVLTVSSTLRAVFKGAYAKATERGKRVSKASLTEKTQDRYVVPFYDWLSERDGPSRSISSRLAIDNWLLW